MSWNCGPRGHGDPAIDAFRRRQIKNFATVPSSAGRPMFVRGDEIAHAAGNNNAYCLDID